MRAVGIRPRVCVPRLGGMSTTTITPSLPFDAVVFDVGGTLVAEATPGTPVDELAVRYLGLAPRALAALRAAGVRIGAVTDTATMREADVRALLAVGGVSDLIEELVTSTDLGVAKPAPDGSRRSCGASTSTTGRVLVVGDRDVDEKAAAAWLPVRPGRRLDHAGNDDPRRRSPPAPRRSAAAPRRPVDGAPPAPPTNASSTHQATRPLVGWSPGRPTGAISGEVPPVPEPAALVCSPATTASCRGVTPWPARSQMIANVAGGAAVSVLARQAGMAIRWSTSASPPLPRDWASSTPRSRPARGPGRRPGDDRRPALRARRRRPPGRRAVATTGSSPPATWASATPRRRPHSPPWRPGPTPPP